MKPEIEIISGRLLGALFDGTWQGLLIVFAVWVALKLSPRVNAATRYAAWMATLLIVAVLPIAHFAIAGQDKLPTLPGVEEANTAPASPSLGDVGNFETVPLEESSEILSDADTAPAPIASPSALPASRHWSFSLPKHYSLYLIAAWLILAAIRLGALSGQLFVLHRIKRKAILAGGPLVRSFGAIHRDMNVARPAFLLTSPQLNSPMVIGFRKAAVILPAALCEQASSAQLEHVLRHELAHVARRDDWANLLQQIIHAIFFFHPGIRLASRRITMEREIACDDHAIAATAARKDYALFLTEFASRVKGRDWAAAPAAWSHTSQLKERISMILDGKRNSSPRLARARAAGITAGALLLALLAFEMAPRVTVAGENEKEVTTTVETDTTITTDSNGSVKVVTTNEKTKEPTIAVITTPRASGVNAASIAPVAPIAVVPATSAAPRAVLIAPGAPRGPRAYALADSEPAPAPPKFKRGGDDDSLERRLDRLERLVERLARDKEKEKDKPAKMDGDKKNFEGKMKGPDRDDDEWNRMRDEIRHHKEEAERQKDLALRNKDEAVRQMERARRDQERAIRDIERQARQAAEEASRASDDANRAMKNSSDPLRAKRDALQRVRHNIDQQLQALQREIEQQERQENQEKREKRERDEKPEPRGKEKTPEDGPKK